MDRDMRETAMGLVRAKEKESGNFIIMVVGDHNQVE